MKKIKLSLNTIFSRILLFNIILVLLVTIVPQTIFVNYFKSTYNTEINQYNMQTVKQIQQSVDELILQKVVNIPNAFFSDLYSNQDLTYPLSNDISRNFTRINNVTKKIADIRNTLDFLDSIEVYYTKGNLLFTDRSVQFLDEGFYNGSPSIEWINRLKSNDMNIAWIPTRKFGEVTQVERNVTTYMRSIPYFNGQELQAIICVNIKEEALRSYFNDIKPFDEQQFLIISEDGSIITRNDDNKQTWNIKDSKIMNKIFQNGSEGLFETKLDGKMSMVSFSKSKYNNWRYVSITSVDNFYNKSSQMNSFLLVICILLLIINLGASVLVTRKAHKPMAVIIKTVNSISKAFNHEAGNNVNEYHLLSNTINGLAYKVDDLNAKLDINKPIIRHNAILKLLNGSINSKANMNSNDEMLDIKFDKGMFMCFILRIFQNKNLSFENEMLINYNIIDLLESMDGISNIRAVINENNVMAGIINYNAANNTDNLLSEITGAIESLINAEYCLCLGNAYQMQYEGIAKSYQEAYEGAKYTFLKTHCKVIRYNDIQVQYFKETGSAFQILEKLEKSVKAGDETKLKFIITSIIEAVKSGNYKIDYCKNTLVDAISIIRNTVINMGYYEDVVFGCDIREYFKSIENVDEFDLWINSVIDTVLLKIRDKRQGTCKEFETKIIKYIDDNIYNDLSLDNVAGALFVSSSYVSKTVKLMTGMSFTDYVMAMKLQHAAKLLSEQNITVKDVASKLGYNSIQYFIRIFREKYGYTPKEYGKKMLKSDMKNEL